jgi:hypothetical protein
MIMRNLVLLALLLVMPLAIAGDPPATSRVMQLPSGVQVRVYGIGRISFADGSHPPSLLVRYESNLEMKDSDALRKEALQVWELLRPMADKAGDHYAMVMANEPIRGAIAKTRRFTYGFERAPGGAWRMREPKKRSN